MQYMGGKARIAKSVVESILADTPRRENWFEPFIGGGNVMEHAAPHFAFSVGADAHEDLMLMWQHVTAGGIVPEFVSREEYQALRHAGPSWLRGYAGFGGSFGGKWFGGYGVSPRDGEVIRASFRSVTRQGAVFAARGVRMIHARFGEIVDPPPGTVVYCDPPYRNTTGYAAGGFDHEYFYATLTRWARTCDVYVSEYSDPLVPYVEIWRKEKRMALDVASNTRVAIERLFRIKAES